MEKILLIKILYGAASIQGIFLAFLLWRARNNREANRILAVLLAFISFHLVLVGFDERQFFMTFPHLSRISWVIGTLYGPFVFLFVERVTGMKIKTRWKVLAFIPFVIVFLSLWPYFIQSAGEKRAYLDAFETARIDDFGWINQFVSVAHIVFAVGNLLLYLNWERRQSEEFSMPEAIRVRWLRQFLIFMAVITLFGVLVFFARIWDVAILSEFYRFHFIGVVFLFYWLSYMALTNPVLFGMTKHPLGHTEAAVIPAVERKKVHPEDETLRVFQKVKTVLETERLFLKSDLTLTELAEKAGVGRNQVSQAINGLSDGNFFDFINEFRVEEFKRRALDPSKKHLSQLGIALESGFNSKASFYAVFKKKTGMTPSEFIERQSSVVPVSPKG